jgi:hypothetical protein
MLKLNTELEEAFHFPEKYLYIYNEILIQFLILFPP